MSISSSLLSGSNHTGFPDFTCTVGEQGSVSSSAFVLLPPSGSHPPAGDPRLADHLVLGKWLDADISVHDHADNCSGDSNIIISKRTISQILQQINLKMLVSLLLL